MIRLLAAGCVLAFAALACADDKKDPKAETAAWVREVETVTLKFELGKDTGTFNVFAGANGVVIKAKLTRDKDKVTAVFTDVKEEGNFPNKPKAGDKISFKWVVKDGGATLSDFEGPDDAKGIVEGEYKLKK